MKHDTDLSLGFDAGNYSAAYDGLSLEAGLEKARYEGKLSLTEADVDSEAYRVAFTLGYLSTLEQNEMGDDLEAYLEAIGSEHGRRCIELGYVDADTDAADSDDWDGPRACSSCRGASGLCNCHD